MGLRVIERDPLHLIFESEFPFFEGNFFDLLGDCEVRKLGELVQPIVEFVVALRQLTIFVVAPQQEVFYLLCFRCAHKPHPPFKKERITSR